MPLTVKQIEKAKPGRHSDGRGLYLLVKPSGAKSWVLRVQYKGNRQDFGIGSVALESLPVGNVPLERRKSLTLAEAREKARIGRELAKAGLNPKHVWAAEDEAQVPNFEKAARDYRDEIKGSWRNGKHTEQWLATLEAYAFPSLGNMLVSDVEASDIQKVLLPIWLSKGETARRVRQRVLAVLDYAHGRGWRELEAPARSLDKLMKGIKQPKASNFAAMPYKELPAFMASLKAAPFSIGRHALQFLLLTNARSGEIRKARWKEIDLEAAEWTQPAEHTKMGKPHIVPLVPAAVALLKEMVGLFAPKPDDLIFSGLKGMMSDATMSKVLRTHGGGDYTVHGFRSTFRDWAAETGFNNDWAEAALAHSVAGQDGKTVAAYKRTTFFEQRRDKLMPAWAAFALNDSSNVISLAERRA